ncbi:glycosyltransferase family 4 protein [Paenibacillus hamazuiensis]|uniref:glycosyltransferase family 4 protein n=1 Tax=Paenibacillus hamazuiensis TaxID=2936508 RepID=UPI00200BDCE4|nr:glycosyltransferase family 1 protein [Paenibacillus hamazuiensis]
MRVALFTDTYLPDVNGVAKTLGRWVRYVESRGSFCKVFAPSSPEPESADLRTVERFYSIPFLLYPECRLALPNPVHVSRSLKQFAPDLIHVATPFNLGLTGMLYAKKHGIPVVASYHTHFDQYLSYYKLQWMENMLWKYMVWFHQECRKIYVPSRSALLHLQEKGLERMEIWGRGVETGQFHPFVDRKAVLGRYGIAPAKFVMLFVGRLAPEKSVDVLLEAWRSLSDEVARHAHLIIVGEGPSAETLRELCAHDPAVTFTGFVQGRELAELYAAADVFVFPSATETFGNVVLEALASGTPVIGAAAGGVRDNISHGVTGLLCPPGDASRFAAAMERLFREEATRAAMAAAGREYALKQSWDSIFSRLYASYAEVAASGEEAICI